MRLITQAKPNDYIVIEADDNVESKVMHSRSHHHSSDYMILFGKNWPVFLPPKSTIIEYFPLSIALTLSTQ